ncbi:T9SS type A sorting domain-containing protein [Flavobacterium sp.]|uniref:T9SS type A sorting domain-containing protein n=1 Tax=Flavobacterium sp. TaxID=239 RepID=UPI0025C0D4B2|nr:T9SS type A sorting domain-containing protein [Flavobacterium sp.]
MKSTRYRFIGIALLSTFFCFSQTWQWGKRGGGNGVSGFDYQEEVRAIETDSQGNVYILSPIAPGGIDIDGNTKPGYGFDDCVLASFACDGSYRWSTIIGGFADDFIQNMQVDANGDVYVIGRPTYGSQFQELFHFDATTALPYSNVNLKQIYIAKYSGVTGNVLWYRFPQPNGLTLSQYGVSGFFDFDLTPDGTLHILAKLSQGVYADGQFNNTTSGLSYFIIQYDTSGNFVGAIPLDMNVSQSGTKRKICNIKKHPINGNYYIAGSKSTNDASISIGGQTLTSPYYVSCFSATGQFLWVKTVATDGSSGNRDLNDFAIDSEGNLYITGTCMDNDVFGSYTVPSSGIGSKPYLLKLDSDGDVIWGTNAVTQSLVRGKAISINGNEVAVSPDFHMITWAEGSYPVVPNGGADASIFRFNKTTGAYIDKTKLSSANGASEVIGYMTTDVFGNYVVGGRFSSNLIINGSTTLSSDDSESDFFVAKFGTADCTLGLEDHDRSQLRIYPNPTQEVVYISIEEPFAYVVYNMLGMRVSEGNMSNGSEGIDVNGLTAGTYFLQVTPNNGYSETLQFVKSKR